ncbi:glycoside hydrolase family 16 protein [Hymenobacter cellulosivorans]|uniref:Glycoside hydrolase family 16 protein n=1 Tax=Hymenobacter cellulosivorans TaxID=2932249 RepID=A0ABY4FAT0_9BACT|nr:glycoside hydrolase family 16 protein [Hymenobacter cellulosivorans]UOQ53281.1 glycoside hydrolase family 16 protein [Hymenobacter cellulosivorans]
MRLFVFLLLLAALPGWAQPSRLPNLDKDYHLVFADDFQYSSRDSLLGRGLNKWSPEHGWGNATWKPTAPCENIGPDNYAYLPQDMHLNPDSAEANDQVLALDYTYHNPPLDSVVSSTGYVNKGVIYRTSGMVRALFQGDSLCPDTGFKYGVFEIRCKVPSTEGLLAAFWLYTGEGACNVRTPNWDSGRDTWEIDGFETSRIEGRRDFFSTLQPNAYIGHKPNFTYYYFDKDSQPDQQYHTYTLVWTENLLAWYADGNLYKVLRNSRWARKANRAGIPRNELHLILSTHFLWDCKSNNHCAFLPDGVTPNDQHCPPPNDPFLIDYIRVYRPNQVDRKGQWPLLEKRNRDFQVVEGNLPKKSTPAQP